MALNLHYEMQVILVKDGCNMVIEDKEKKSTMMADEEFANWDEMVIANPYPTLDISVLFLMFLWTPLLNDCEKS